ncbi:MAG: hypothetical protein U0835_14125 [Isosphaeraceae bacterium]
MPRNPSPVVPAAVPPADPLVARLVATEDAAAAPAAFTASAELAELDGRTPLARPGRWLRSSGPPVAPPEQPAVPLPPPAPNGQRQGPKPVLDRDQCMEFAIGSIGAALGPKFAGADAFPTRVRLPDEPLMLVDRITAIEGEPLSMTSGRVVTEHDVNPGDWYLDYGKTPVCIAIESGQADLFLSGWLGIDFITRGEAVYRLLDATIMFHRGLPVAGEVIRYDIRISKFFRQGDTHLFRFKFDGTIDGQPVMTMRDQRGVFSAGELAAGKGSCGGSLDMRPIPGKRPAATGAKWCRWQSNRTTTAEVDPPPRGLRPPGRRSRARAEDPLCLPGGRLHPVAPGRTDRPDRRSLRPGRDPQRAGHSPRRLVPHLPLHRRPGRLALMYECLHALRILSDAMG